ncbi:hypothetical protein HID58_073117 [Brassica napus]|uniref:NAD(P)-binding domain-containing protein n=1 Tax=Brassica napus TaxID=3708 RepID=A0ABQ7Z6L9_BRANA|nr:hypothetical protein HID58_073117 [Brassica napus]
MAGSSLPSSLLTQGGPALLFSSSNQVSEAKCQLVVTSGKRSLVRCLAKKKISFVDQILDYIEGGPKLRKWYGAPELLPKDGSSSEEDDEAEEQEEDALDGVKDTVFVTDGDSDVGQMIILQLIVKGTRVKALVKDKRKAMEAFGAYVELTSGDASDERFLRKAFRGVGAIISPTEGFLSNVKSLKGVKHVVLLSQLSVYESSGGIEAMMNSKAKKLAEGDEKAVISSNVPYTIIRTGKLENSPGGNQGFNFSSVSNGEEAVSDWEGQLMKLMQRQNQKK